MALAKDKVINYSGIRRPAGLAWRGGAPPCSLCPAGPSAEHEGSWGGAELGPGGAGTRVMGFGFFWGSPATSRARCQVWG